MTSDDHLLFFSPFFFSVRFVVVVVVLLLLFKLYFLFIHSDSSTSSFLFVCIHFKKSLRKWMQTKRKDEVEESEWMVVRGQIQRMADSAEVILVWLEVTRVYSQDSLACENCFREKRSSRSSTFSLSFYLANNLPYSASSFLHISAIK